MQGLGARSNVEWAVITTKKDVTDKVPALVAASPAFANAILHTTKGTIEKLVMRVEGYVTAGIEGKHLPFPRTETRNAQNIGVGMHSATGDAKTSIKSAFKDLLKKKYSECI